MATQTQAEDVNTLPASDTRESDIEQVYLTQSDEVAAAQAPVQIGAPVGTNIIRIQATPGEAVQLPFSTDALTARLGDGNLAVKSGDVTVILLGYTAAIEQEPVTLVGSDGKGVDVATVLEETDPSVDIQTSAGPIGSQGVGVDNNGGLFAPFDPQNGIGGFEGVDGLLPTAVQYGTIQVAPLVIIEEEEPEDTVQQTTVPPDEEPGLAPVNLNDANAGGENERGQNNVMIVLDRSGSMNDDADGAGPGTQTRIELARAAIVDLIAKYDQVSDVRVLIVQFSTDGQRMQQWGTPAEALAYIDGNQPAGTFTSYSNALAQARAGLVDNDGKLPGAPVTVYFLSDGLPNADGANAGIGGGLDHNLTPAQMTLWNDSLEANNVAHVYAIGIGADVAADDSDLVDVANPNGNPNNTPDSDVIVVIDPTQLSAQLQDTVEATTITGNVLNGQDTSGDGDNGLPGAADTEGAGAAFIHTFQHDGAGTAFDTEFTWDGVAGDVAQVGAGGTNVTIAGQLVSFDTEFGRMSFNFGDGSYEFVAGSVDADEDVTFHYGTTDSAGETDEAGGTDADNANSVPGGADLVISITNGETPIPAILLARDVITLDVDELGTTGDGATTGAAQPAPAFVGASTPAAEQHWIDAG